MGTRQVHPFGGEAAVLYLAIQDQIAKQVNYLTVADVWAVLALLAEESRAQLGMDMMAKLHSQALKELGADKGEVSDE